MYRARSSLASCKPIVIVLLSNTFLNLMQCCIVKAMLLNENEGEKRRCEEEDARCLGWFASGPCDALSLHQGVERCLLASLVNAYQIG